MFLCVYFVLEQITDKVITGGVLVSLHEEGREATRKRSDDKSTRDAGGVSTTIAALKSAAGYWGSGNDQRNDVTKRRAREGEQAAEYFSLSSLLAVLISGSSVFKCSMYGVNGGLFVREFAVLYTGLPCVR